MGPKGKRSSPSEKPFLFVNEDFNSLFGGTRNTDLDRTKQSHVQRQSFARRKRGSSKKRSGDVSPVTGTISPSAGSSTIIPESESSTSRDIQLPLRFPELTFASPDTAWLPAIADQGASIQPQQQDYFSTSNLSGWQSLQATWPAQNLYAQPQLLRANSRQITARLAYPTSDRGSPLDNELSMPSSEFFASPSPSLLAPDPFHDMKTALELWAPPLMRSYATETIASIFDTDLQATSLENMRHISGLHADMQSCMAQPAEMYSLLAVTSLILLAEHGQIDLPRLAPEDSSRVPLMFKTKALEALRLRLSGGSVTHGTVLAVHRMVCAALFNGNYVAVDTHYRACIALMDTLGGLESFDDFQKERLIMHDLYYTFATLSPSRLKNSWDPGQLAYEIVLQIPSRADTYGGRLRGMIEELDQNIHPAVGEAIPELMETQDVLSWLQTQEYRPNEYRWLMHRRLSIVYKLVNVKPDPVTRDELLGANQNVVRYAAIYYAMAVISQPFTHALVVDQFIVIAQQLWNDDFQDDHWHSSTDLLLWTVVMLSLCITFGKHSERIKEQLSIGDLTTRLHEVGRNACENLGIETEEQLTTVLKTFLFEDRFADERFKIFVRDSLGLVRT